MLAINPLSVISLANIFFLEIFLLGYLFLLSVVSFAVKKLLSLIRSHLFMFAFISITLGDESAFLKSGSGTQVSSVPWSFSCSSYWEWFMHFHFI